MALKRPDTAKSNHSIASNGPKQTQYGMNQHRKALEWPRNSLKWPGTTSKGLKMAPKFLEIALIGPETA
jgi:hypothetical protein